MVEHEDECPECDSPNTYEAECGNPSCIYCGSLFFFCGNCGYTDHEDCTYEDHKIDTQFLP